jgi:hypothetical protein
MSGSLVRRLLACHCLAHPLDGAAADADLAAHLVNARARGERRRYGGLGRLAEPRAADL